MPASAQTILALGVVAIAALALVRWFFKQRKQPGCGADCGAVSPEVKKLQAKLRR
jgi:hypothetical protein